MTFVRRVRDILLRPASTWSQIEIEPSATYKAYVGILALIPAVAGFMGMSVIGFSVFGITVRAPVVPELYERVFGYLLSLVWVCLFALIINVLARRFGGTRNLRAALKLTAYASTAAFVGGIFSLIPSLTILGTLAGLYSFYLIYTGLPVLMKCPPKKALAYTLVTGLCSIPLAVLMVDVRFSPMSAGPEHPQVLLPGAVGGLSRTAFEYAASSAKGFPTWSERVEYGKAGQRLEMVVSDGGRLMSAPAWLGAKYDKQANGNVENVHSEGNRIVREAYATDGTHAEYSAALPNGVMVAATGERLGLDAVGDAVKALDLGRIESLPRHVGVFIGGWYFSFERRVWTFIGLGWSSWSQRVSGSLAGPAQGAPSGQLPYGIGDPKLRQAAMNGDPTAAYEIGLRFAEGTGVAVNYGEAAKWYDRAARAGVVPAIFQLGTLYENGLGVAQNDAEAARWYGRAAELGDAGGQNNLGRMYASGRGVARNDAQAVVWYRKAAERGYAVAQYNLGIAYRDGLGLARDDAQAIVWLRKAADQGDADAQEALRGMEADGRANPNQDQLAAVLRDTRAAAERGDVRAQSELGVMYQNGRGVARDNVQAVAWYRKAADQGDAVGQFNLGLMYRQGLGVARDDAQAVSWYRKAADQGLAQAQYNLGSMYANGLGVARDDTEAVSWCRKAAEQGLAQAQYILAWNYASGLGVVRDDTQAVAWFRKAAEQGHADAQSNLASMYMSGHGVARDVVQAVAWVRKAAEQGHAQAQGNLGVAYRDGLGNAQDDAQAASWFRKAADQGNTSAQVNLGFMYANGRGVVRDNT